MASKEFGIVKSLIPKLTKEEKNILIKLLLIQTGKNIAGGEVQENVGTLEEDNCSLVFDRLTKYVSGYYKVFVSNGRNRKILLDATEVLNDIWDNRIKSKPGTKIDKASKLFFYDETFKLSIQYLKSHKIPVSAKSILNVKDKYYGFLDRAYPGYLESGYFLLFVQDVTRSKKSH